MFLRSLDLSEQIKGKIEFCKTLITYLSYNDVFELPTFHAGLYGLVKAFVGSTFHPAERVQAHDNLFSYAAMVEQHLPESMLSYNLHILVRRLKKQEEAKGCVARCGKLWVGRGIQDVKSNVNTQEEQVKGVFLCQAALHHTDWRRTTLHSRDSALLESD
ncbi:hypothetical protein WJX77_007855 [Trebouxia sp. C0004]